MKKKISIFLKIAVFILLIIVIGRKVQIIISPKFDASQGARSSFFEEEENSIDVLFLGTSNMFHTINPIVLYESTGITSFDFGSSAQSLNMTEMYLEEALKTQSPEIVCVEVLQCRRDANNDLYEPGMRWGFTYFPNTIDKYRRLYKQLHSVDAEYLSYVVPLFRYKDRWKELNKKDFDGTASGKYWKGCTVSRETVEVNYDSSYWEDSDWEIPESNIKSLDNIKHICEENGIELILFKSPTPSLWREVYSQRVQEYADENGLVFIDYNKKLDELGIDVKTDFKDAGHVNVRGSVKITRDFGNYLKNNYELKDHRGGENNSWDRAEKEKMRRENNSQLSSLADLDSFMTALSDEDYTVICCTAGEDTWELTKKLERRYGVSSEYLVRCNGSNILFGNREEDFAWHDTMDGFDCAFGYRSGTEDAAESVYIYVDGVDYTAVQHGINIVVIDNQLGELVRAVGFDADNEYAKVTVK